MSEALTFSRTRAATVLTVTLLMMPALPRLAGSLARQADDGAVICVGPDSVMRAAGPSGECPTGHTKLTLETEPEPHEAESPWDPTRRRTQNPPASRPLDRLERLEQRLGVIERSPVFEVVDKQSRIVFRVGRGSARLFTSRGLSAVEVHAAAEGGYLGARSSSGTLETVMGVSTNRAGLRLREGGEPRIDLGKKELKNYSLTIPSPDDDVVAGIGESTKGGGLMVLGNADGNTRATMAGIDGKGSVTVFNRIGVTALVLTEGDAGGGSIYITDGVQPVVKMNTNGRYGAVLAGPAAGFPLVWGSGLPGSYFLGCAGGPACRP